MLLRLSPPLRFYLRRVDCFLFRAGDSYRPIGPWNTFFFLSFLFNCYPSRRATPSVIHARLARGEKLVGCKTRRVLNARLISRRSARYFWCAAMNGRAPARARLKTKVRNSSRPLDRASEPGYLRRKLIASDTATDYSTRDRAATIEERRWKKASRSSSKWIFFVQNMTSYVHSRIFLRSPTLSFSLSKRSKMINFILLENFIVILTVSSFSKDLAWLCADVWYVKNICRYGLIC